MFKSNFGPVELYKFLRPTNGNNHNQTSSQNSTKNETTGDNKTMTTNFTGFTIDT